jgi:two-component system KDP operon response regulator KdpE
MKATVLIVDDEPQIRRAVRHALEHDAWRVAEAATGRDALIAISGDRPDVIVLDLGLPDADGSDICREIRTYRKKGFVYVLCTLEG